MEERTGCLMPHSCATRAKELLDTLPPKWDPRQVPPPQNVASTQESASPIKEGWIYFDAKMVTKGNVADLFRVITEGKKS